MQSDTFMDEGVTSYLEEHFEPISVDIWSSEPISENDPGITGTYIASEYQVPGAPSSAFLTPDGTLIGVAPGYKPPAEFKMLLEYVATDAYKEMTFEQYVNSQQ
jgi:thioredoxin-related protein